MKQLVFVLALALVATALPSAATATPSNPVAAPRHVLKDTGVLDARFTGVLNPGVEYHAVVTMASGSVFEIVFYPETAPNHVANFVSLARKGYYDGTTFHRVLPGFMAQGGDPTGTGSGGPGYTIRAEFSSLPHQRGTISMARTSDPNSAGSQFFVCFQPTPFLNGQYTVFGEVAKGMENVDRIRPRDPQRNPDFTGDAIKTVTITEVKAATARPARNRGRSTNR